MSGRLKFFSKERSTYLLFLPLFLSAFIHMWNPTGFPSIYWDEDTHYLQKALIYNKYGDPQAENPRLYAHPYFGQIFLGTLLGVINYPHAFVTTSGISDIASVNVLYQIPRIIMGLLAVLDTFFLYKIGDFCYGRKVAFICSILFAVMPITWLLKRILLDNLVLPFVLSSLMIACYATISRKETNEMGSENSRRTLLILLSGILLGLAIFTKIPAFTLIPLFIFLVYSRMRSKRFIWIWLAPVILIPLIWPTYALLGDHLDLWLRGVIWQAEGRPDRPLLNSIEGFIDSDPLLLIIGISGICYMALRRDFFPILWIIPFIAFTIIVNFVSLFHLVFIIPVLCISGAKMIVDIYDKIKNKMTLRTMVVSTITVIVIFGTASSITLISMNLTSPYFKIISFVNNYLPNIDSRSTKIDDKVTVVGLARYFWIPQYAFEKSGHYYYNWDRYVPPLDTKKILFVIPAGNISEILSGNDKHSTQLRFIYDNTIPVAIFDPSSEILLKSQFYPYTNSLRESQIPQKIEVRANY